ncbi:NUDIX domain-containing protein [Kitasatospora sp. NPDC101157]|uniref:NUDIX domain-containing protein n=1 Tax=Kitasatospora sp. NPDC101157 TaxID=3364098 RepID=UPI0038211691
MCALLLHDGRLALIRRDRPDGVQHSLTGGLVEDGEDPHAALRREILEELALNADGLPEPPVLRFVLYPDIAAVLGQAVQPSTAACAPVLLPAMTATSYQWR